MRAFGQTVAWIDFAATELAMAEVNERRIEAATKFLEYQGMEHVRRGSGVSVAATAAPSRAFVSAHQPSEFLVGIESAWAAT